MRGNLDAARGQHASVRASANQLPCTYPHTMQQAAKPAKDAAKPTPKEGKGKDGAGKEGGEGAKKEGGNEKKKDKVTAYLNAVP